MSPDGSTKPPPEEKLLRLLRGKGPKAAAGSAATASSVFGPAAVSVLLVREGSGALASQWPRLAVAGLGALLLVEAGLLATQAMQPLPVVDVPAVSTTDTPSHPVAPLPEAPSLTSSAVHPLFAAPIEVTPVVPTPQTPTKPGPSALASVLSSRLTLMGVISGNPPQAIIEDAQTKKTYFVAPGQSVVEGATLSQVLDNRVILDLNGEQIELSL